MEELLAMYISVHTFEFKKGSHEVKAPRNAISMLPASEFRDFSAAAAKLAL